MVLEIRMFDGGWGEEGIPAGRAGCRDGRLAGQGADHTRKCARDNRESWFSLSEKGVSHTERKPE